MATTRGWTRPGRAVGRAGSTRTRPATVSGSVAACSAATRPPIELPIRIAGPVRERRPGGSTPLTSRRWPSMSAARPAAGSARGRPGRGPPPGPVGGACGATADQLRWEPPSPWRARSRGPPSGPPMSSRWAGPSTSRTTAPAGPGTVRGTATSSTAPAGPAGRPAGVSGCRPRGSAGDGGGRLPDPGRCRATGWSPTSAGC